MLFLIRIYSKDDWFTSAVNHIGRHFLLHAHHLRVESADLDIQLRPVDQVHAPQLLRATLEPISAESCVLYSASFSSMAFFPPLFHYASIISREREERPYPTNFRGLIRFEATNERGSASGQQDQARRSSLSGEKAITLSMYERVQSLYFPPVSHSFPYKCKKGYAKGLIRSDWFTTSS